MSLFPIFLKLTARPCIVIGAGHLAESKIESLLTAQAHVTVIAPNANLRILDLVAAGEIHLHTRAYAPGDLTSKIGPPYFLAVAATDDPVVNRAVFAEAEAAGILINAVDDPPFCDFYFPSVVRRGDLQIAISTAGHSPALAQRLRKEINQILPLDAGDWLNELGNLRREVLQLEPLNDARKEILHTLASRDVCSYDACPSRTLARRHAETNPRPQASSPTPPTIRPCNKKDVDAILAIINDGAQAYRGVIPPDRLSDPYMSRENLLHEIAAGVTFWGREEDGVLAGVMGIQSVRDVTLIRHAYVRSGFQKRGIGAQLLGHLRRLTSRPVLIGTWAAALWAIRFYQNHGFEVVDPASKERLLRTYWTVPDRQIETSVVLADAAGRSLIDAGAPN